MNAIEAMEYIPLKLDEKIQRYAKKFAWRQATPEKRKQVYLNTLAVCAVHSYLNWMELETDPTISNSWNPLAQSVQNTADLTLKGVGDLECRPLEAGETEVKLPREARENRLACVVVLIENTYDRVKILGAYLPEDRHTLPATVHLSQLHSCEQLRDYLKELEPFPAEELDIVAQLSQELQEKLRQCFPSEALEMFLNQAQEIVETQSGKRGCQRQIRRLLRELLSPQQEVYALNSNLGTSETVSEVSEAEIMTLAEQVTAEMGDFQK
jgi:hypothetical protein